MSHDNEYMVAQINEHLAGTTIKNAVISDDKQSFGLIVVKKAKGRGNYTEFPVWVDRDAEGNGSGWLSIEQ